MSKPSYKTKMAEQGPAISKNYCARLFQQPQSKRHLKFLAIGRTKTLLDVDFVKGATGKHYLAINDDDSVTCTAVLDAGDGVTEPKIISKDEWYDTYRYVHMRINNVAEYANTSEQRVLD